MISYTINTISFHNLNFGPSYNFLSFEQFFSYLSPLFILNQNSIKFMLVTFFVKKKKLNLLTKYTFSFFKINLT